MKVKYRGDFEIEVYRGKSIAGIELLFYSVFRIKDGFEVTSGYSYSDETVREYIKGLKEHVDRFIEAGEPEDAEYWEY